MAIAERSESQSGTGAAERNRAGSNRTIWVVMITLLVALVAGGVLAGKSTMPSPVNQGMRAVIVPTDDAARTVAVTPCGTGAPISSGKTANVFDVVGVTMIGLPQGTGVRIVLIPRCAAGSGAAAGTSLLPSAAFVPRPGTKVPPPGSGKSSSSSGSSSSAPIVADPKAATSELVVSPGSDVRTVVVSPCTRASAGPALVDLGSSPGTPGTAVAPAC
jgi:hypothetical protein